MSPRDQNRVAVWALSVGGRTRRPRAGGPKSPNSRLGPKTKQVQRTEHLVSFVHFIFGRSRGRRQRRQNR